MGRNDHIDDDEYSNFLREVIAGNHLEGKALGITKLVAEKGIDALSSKQLFVFKEEVTSIYTVEACSRCGSPIPWSEMYAALDNGKQCNYCWHMSNKSKSE